MEVIINVILRFFPRDGESLRETETADAVHDSEIDGLGVSSHLVRNLIERNVEHLRRRSSVDILRFAIGFYQLLIPGHMGKHTQFYL